MSNDRPQSSYNYPELDKPEFKSSIPPHLLNNTDDQTKYVLKQLDMINQQNEWLIRAAVDTNEQVRHTNGRLKSIEKWKETLEEKHITEKLDMMDTFKDTEFVEVIKIVKTLKSFWVVFGGIIGFLAILGSAILSILKLSGIM